LVVLSELFPSTILDHSQLPDIPLFVTAFSANHFQEGLCQMKNFHKYATKDYPGSRFLFYDLGLTKDQRLSVSVR